MKPTKAQHADARMWLCWSLGGGLMPLWGSFLVLGLLGLSPPFMDYLRHGEFMLYAAAFLAPACHQLFRELPTNFPGRSKLGFITVSALVVSVLVFGGLIAYSRWCEVHDAKMEIHDRWLVALSFIVLGIAVVLAWWIMVIDMARAQYDAREVDEEQVAELADEVRKLQGKTSHGG